MRARAVALGVLAVAFLCAFAVFVWPTRYRYFETGYPMPMRMDRLTLKVERWAPGGGWEPAFLRR